MQDETYRNRLIDTAVSVFSKDGMDERTFESFVARVQEAGDREELEALAKSMQQVFPKVEAAAVREFTLSMSNMKKAGDWIDSRAYRLIGKMSNFDLDFTNYEGSENFSLVLDVDLSMSNLKITAPHGWTVDCRVSQNIASNIKDKGSNGDNGDNRIIVVGSLKGSNIKVKYRSRGERKGPLAFFFRWGS